MKKRLIASITVIVLMMGLAVIALAQGPGGPGGPGQGPGGANPWKAMMEKSKYTWQFMGMLRQMGEINKDPKYALTPPQAKSVLKILKPLRSQPKLTQDQAKQALKSLKKVFTVEQLNAMARVKEQSRRPGMGGPGGRRGMMGSGKGPMGTGGKGPMGGGFKGNMKFDPNRFKDYNPLYTKDVPKDNEFAKMAAKRWDEFFAGLEKKAKGK